MKLDNLFEDKSFLLEAKLWWPNMSHAAAWLMNHLLEHAVVSLTLDRVLIKKDKSTEDLSSVKVECIDGDVIHFRTNHGLRSIGFDHILTLKVVSPKKLIVKNLLRFLQSTDINKRRGDINDYFELRDLKTLKQVLTKLDVIDEPDVKTALTWLTSQLQENTEWWWPDPPASAGWLLGELLHNVNVTLTFSAGNTRDVTIFSGEWKEFQARVIKPQNTARRSLITHLITYRIDHLQNIQITSPIADVIKNLLRFIKVSVHNGDFRKSERPTLEELLERLDIQRNPEVKKIMDWLRKQEIEE